jgi:AraC-like DNA-binding protein/mannose-6-phosphate isomerase-like protein (cupin superfamily)
MPDVLSEVLAVTRLKGTVYFSAELQAPWGIALPHRRRAPFYVVTKGQCEITLDGAPSLGVSLGPGDLVVLPGGTAHTLASSATTGTIPLEQFVARFPMDERGHVNALDGKGPTTSLIGGFFELERAPEPLVAVLPPLIHLPGEDAEVSGWLDQTLRSIAHEAAQALPGRAVVLNRLADVLFVRVVRAYLLKLSAGGATGPPSWLRGLTDPRIARALAQIHRAPEQAWTLAQLASRAAMSRAAFAQRFHALVGQTPVSYLTGWRMQKAAYLLEMGTLSIAQVAEQVGYTSELAFAKAFRRLMGMPPGAYARQHTRR